MPTLTDFSELKDLYVTLHHREDQTKKQAKKEKLDREIAELEAMVRPVQTYELTCPDVPTDITRRGGRYVQKRKAIH